MTTIGIYKITSPSNKVYIGQSWNIEFRKRNYKNLKCKQQRHIYFSLLKYGFDAHSFEIVHVLPEDISQNVLDNYEFIYWNQYKTCGFCMLNLKQPGPNSKLSDETKKYMSFIRKGIPKTEEWKEKVRKPKPEGFGKNVKNRQIGRKLSEKTKLKISNSRKGKLSPLKGRKVGEKPEEIRLKLRKPIQDLSTGIVYESGIHAAKALGFTPGYIPYLVKKGKLRHFEIKSI